MNENIKLIEFSELRKIAVEMRVLLIDKLGLYPEEFNFKSGIEDLGCSGDDAIELLEELHKQYQIDFQGFNFGDYFFYEGEGLGAHLLIIGIIILFLNISLLLTSFLSVSLFDKISAYKIKLLQIFNIRHIKPLTVGDLITSAIEKKFTLRKDLQYKISYKSPN